MGNVYNVPRNVKGESRILFIFTVKSFMTTIGGAIVGGVLFLFCSALGTASAGAILLLVSALVGFLIGTLTIPDSPIMGKFRKAGGEPLATILARTLLFYKKKKIYVYRKGVK